MGLIQSRNSTLIRKAYKKLVIPETSIKICKTIVILVDSLIASRYIGVQAMAAIALIVPISLFESCLHDLLVSGTTPLLIRYKSRGMLKEANRAFGAILTNAFLWYVICCALVIIFAESILGLFTDDSQLIANSILYLIPIAITEPFVELGLCFERGFLTDGRNGFFGIRGIITNCANIVFSLIAVLELNGGIVGISIASVLASLLGYAWSFSYFFSKKCTIRPDFSVLSNLKEVKEYLFEEMKIGGVYALDDGLLAGASALFSKAVIYTGGASALAAVGICNAVTNIVDTINSGIKDSGTNLISLFYGDRDYKGIGSSLKLTICIQGAFSAFAWIIIVLFSYQIGMIYKVDSEEVMAALKLCLCFDTITVIADSYTNFFSSYMLVTDRSKAAANFAIVFNIMVALCALTGFLGGSFAVLLIVRACGAAIITFMEAAYVFSQKKRMSKICKSEIRSFSYILTEPSSAEISRKIKELLDSISALSTVAVKASLLTEECNKMILYVNRERETDICVDFRVSADERGCVITLIDTGMIFDPIHRLNQGELLEEYAISRQILKEFSPEASYARVVNLNVTHLVIPLYGN